MDQDNKHLWDRFCRLGEMMGDGLHHESDGKWIERDYKALSKILIPEIAEVYNTRRSEKGHRLNQQMSTLLQEKKCSCGGQLRQSRSGSVIAYCMVCNSRYKAAKRKSGA